MEEELEWGWAKPAKYFEALWIRHRLKQQDFERIWEEQGGLCAGCRRALAHPWQKSARTGLKPSVDGGGEGRAARGILCASCRQALVQLESRRGVFAALEAYLKRHERRT